MEKLITIYHGSKEIVEVPEFGKGKKNNDFGLGFYCTESDAWQRNGLYHLFETAFQTDIRWIRNI